MLNVYTQWKQNGYFIRNIILLYYGKFILKYFYTVMQHHGVTNKRLKATHKVREVRQQLKDIMDQQKIKIILCFSI